VKEEFPLWAMAVLGVLLAVAVLLPTTLFVVRRVLLYRQLKARRAADVETQVRSAIRMIRSLSYPAVFVRGTDFVLLGKLTMHEKLRDAGMLVTRDTLDKTSNQDHIFFFSHQWTSVAEPDPTNVQYQAAVLALQAICEAKGWPLESALVWFDYCSIPQLCRAIQGLAIDSLHAYAKHADVFVIVAPKITLVESGTPCDYKSYQRRMWCRAEQLCHALKNSTDNMYLSTDAWRPPQQLATSTSWISENLKVFEGECSVESDRLKLVSPLLSLYAEALGDRKNPIAKAVLADISRDKGRIFPKTFNFKDEQGVVHTQELFGNAIEKLEEMLVQDKKLHRALKRSSTRPLSVESPPSSSSARSSTQAEGRGFFDSLCASRRSPFASSRQSQRARSRVSPEAGDDSLQGTMRSELSSVHEARDDSLHSTMRSELSSVRKTGSSRSDEADSPSHTPSLMRRGGSNQEEQRAGLRSQEEAEKEREADEDVDRPRRTDGPLTADEREHARLLADELRPLFKRMAPEEQVALLTELADEPDQVRSLF
jgi:hypothetical protein